MAFVDANCEPEPGWLEALLPHFADPRMAAVAPGSSRSPTGGARRPVDHEAGAMSDRTPTSHGSALPRWLAAYEAVASPLDLGAREATVRPRSPVAYVPTAALVVRRAALEELGGFDETLPFGEDVDLVWRLVAAGWTVRYEPGAAVRHPIRPGGGPGCASATATARRPPPLARRHGPAVAPAVVSPWTAAAWALVAAGHPLGAAAAGYVGRRPRPPLPHRREAVRLAGSRASPGRAGAWPGPSGGPGRRPRSHLAVASRRSRPALAAAVIVPGLLEWSHGGPGSIRPGSWPWAWPTTWPTPPESGPAAPGSARPGLCAPISGVHRATPLRQTYQPLSGSIGGQG